jgi:plastocyanin
MNRYLLGFVVFSALVALQVGCDDDRPRKRDGGPGGTGGSLTGGTSGGGTGGSPGTGGAPMDAALTDARLDGGAADAVPADATVDRAADTVVMPDAAADVAIVSADASADVARDVAPDVAADTSPDVAPDLAPDVAPDLAADVAPDVAPDLSPDVAPDTMTMQFMALPGCSTENGYTTAANLSPTVSFGGGLGNAYSPRCLKVARTAQVTFSGNFGGHPLSPTTGMGSPANPITSTSNGNSATFTFNASGFFPYHCDFHDQSSGMHGVIWVIP